MDLFLHETATFRSAEALPGPAAIEEYLESPVVNADDQPAFDAAFRAAHLHAPHAIGRLLVRRYHGAVYGDAGCLAWLLTVTGTKLLAIVAIYAMVNSTGPGEMMLAFAALGVGTLAAGMLLVLHCRRRNLVDCASFVETLEPLSERDPAAIVETLPLLERVAADSGIAETTRSSAG